MELYDCCDLLTYRLSSILEEYNVRMRLYRNPSPLYVLFHSISNKSVGTPYCLVKMYAGRIASCRWWVCRQNRQTDGRTPDRHITLSAGRGQRNNNVQLHALTTKQRFVTKIISFYFQVFFLSALWRCWACAKKSIRPIHNCSND